MSLPEQESASIEIRRETRPDSYQGEGILYADDKGMPFC